MNLPPSITAAVVVLSWASAAVVSHGGETGREWLGKLADESYPRRVEAERELARWAINQDAPVIEWLFGTWRDAADPEVRARLYAVLRERVMMDLEQTRPGFVGIQMQALEFNPGEGPGTFGVGVGMVTPDSPAETAGLKVGDVILDLNGKGWTEEDASLEFADRVGSLKPGTEIDLTVSRGRKCLEFRLTLAPRPWAAGEFGQFRQLQAGIWRGNIQLLGMQSEDEAREEAFRKWLDERIAADAAGP